jgi:Prolyl oligopeptidase family
MGRRISHREARGNAFTAPRDISAEGRIVTGWREGGYISAFITIDSDRFKAVSVGAEISDWLTYYVNTDIHPFTRQYLL